MSSSKSARRDGRTGEPSGIAFARELGHALLLVAAGAATLYLGAYLPSRLKTDALRARNVALHKERDKLAAEVKELRAEARALDQDPWAVERALRRKLGFLRPGERVLKLER